jgi:GNAT superfamily N-acetyltransferase
MASSGGGLERAWQRLRGGKTATLPTTGEVPRMFPEQVLTCRERDHRHADYPGEEQQGITAAGVITERTFVSHVGHIQRGPGPAGAPDRQRVPVPYPCSSGASPGSGLRIRQAVPGDREALAAMLTRCRVATRHGRFHAPVRYFPEPYLSEALAGPAEHFALVAEQDGAAVALASCRIDPAGGAELGILVEDRWQRRGIGTRLLSRLIQHADQHGLRPLKARVLAEQRWVLRVLRHYGTCQAAYSFNAFDVELHRSPAMSANECK